MKTHQNEFIGKFFATCNICKVKTEGKGVGGYMIEVVCFEEQTIVKTFFIYLGCLYCF